jgi:uncharacterized protein
MTISKEVLDQMTQIIVDEMHPSLVLMFGSQARGEAGPDSDLDLIIVQDQETIARLGRRQQLGNMYRLLSHFPILVDLLLYSNEEFDRKRDWLNHVIPEAVREGKVLYEHN